MAAHRSRIRELMIEKEMYTQKYLGEKRKYDELLIRVNSTSTLESMSSDLSDFAETKTSLSSPVELELVEGSSSGIGQSNELLEGKGRLGAPYDRQSQSCLRETRSDTSVPTNHKVLADGISKSDHEILSASMSPTLRDQHSGQASDTPQIYHQRLSEQGEQQSVLAPCTTDGQVPSKQQDSVQHTYRSALGPPQIEQRQKAAKIAREIAKGVGYLAMVIISILTFPIAIPVFFMIRKRQRRVATIGNEHAGVVSDLESTGASPQAQHPTAYNIYPLVSREDCVCGPCQPSQDTGFPAGVFAYHSADMRAELPGMHELPYIAPELELTNILTHAELPRIDSEEELTIMHCY